MKTKGLLLLMVLGLISCSPKKQLLNDDKSGNLKTEIENLIQFEDMNTDLKADGSAVLKSKLGAILPSTILPLDIEVDDQGVQIIRLQSKERRANIDMVISEGVAPAGISMSHNCPAQLRRRQSCYMTINIDASAIGEGSLASHNITINNETYTVQYNVIASTKLTAEQEAEGLIEVSPSEASPIAFGTLEKTESEKDSQTIQLRNKSRKSLPVVIDQSGLSSVSMTTTCQASLDRGRACLVFLSLDSSSLNAGAISESIVVSGKTFSITGNINERNQAEIDAFEQTLADNAIVLSPATSIDIGQVKQGRTKIGSIQITNQSRGDVNLNIDGSSLSEFSMGSCPAILGKRRSCYLSITYDATSASVGAKSESLTIGSTSYSVNAEVIAGEQEQGGGGGCSTTYDGSLASYFTLFPEPANFVESLACENLTFPTGYAGIIFPETSTVVPQYHAGEGIQRISFMSYTGQSGQCTISGSTHPGNVSRVYYQKEHMSESGCVQLAKDMESELNKNTNLSEGICMNLGDDYTQWTIALYEKSGLTTQQKTDLCEVNFASFSPSANRCSNFHDSSSCASAHGGECYWDATNSYCIDTKNFGCSEITNEGLCNASGCTYINCDEGSGECDSDPDYQTYMVTDQCVGVNSATACSDRSMMTMDEFECTSSQYRGNNCYWNMDMSMCEDEQTPDPVCENNTQEGSCISSSGGCMWNAGICEAPVATSCTDYMNETQCMDDMQAFGNCSWDGSSCQEDLGGGSCSGPDPANDETCQMIGYDYHDGNVCDYCP